MDELTGLSNMDALTGLSNIEFPGKGKGKGLEQAASKFKGGLKKQGKFSPDDSLVTSTSFEPESEVIFDPFGLERDIYTTGVSPLDISFDGNFAPLLFWERGTIDGGYSGDIQAI
jgi:hypothetical protein